MPNSLPTIILGSQSPRRAQILKQLGISFIQSPSTYEEVFPNEIDNAPQLVETLARNKGECVNQNIKNSIVITSDTLVICQGKVFGKPKTREHAFDILKQLRDTPHQVVTGIAIRYKDKVYSGSEVTTVFFQKLSDKYISKYAQTAPILDKAGAYEVQGTGSIIIESIEGCYYNVMGLPVELLKNLLGKVGIDLWDYINLDAQL